MNRLHNFMSTTLQVIVLTLIWYAANQIVTYFHLPLPANLIGMLLLLVLVLTHVIHPEWLRRGATWLLAEMLLFFVPAVMAVMKYPTLIREHGLQIVLVIFLSTLCVIAVTGIVVQQIHRVEVRMMRQRRNQHHLKMSRG